MKQTALALLLAAAMCAHAAERPPGVIRLDETVISGNQELPKVLYILPWQQPDGLPEIDVSTDHAERGLFQRLYPPAHRRALAYREAAAERGSVPDSKER